MNRRALLKTLFGGAVVATGGAALLSSTTEAEAAVPRAANLLDEMRAAAPAVATETDIENAQVEDVQWGPRCWRNRWGEIVCRRPARRVIVRPRRRCWRNRWGQIVCRY